MINTTIIDALQLMFEHFDDCVPYIEKSYKIDDDEPYYRFSTKLMRDWYSPEITFELETATQLNDSVKISHMDEELHVENWIAMNEDVTGVVVFVEHSRNNTRSIVFNTSGKMVFRDRNSDNVEFDIPLTEDEFFNINLLHGMDLQLSYIRYIDSFIKKNKKLIDDYKIALEHSSYEI